MTLEIRLLGRPSIARDGRPVAQPRGHKAWALLAYLLLSGAPVTRERLSSLLFPEADDPLRALRWSLAQLRRMLGDGEIGGQPVTVTLPPEAFVDVHAVLRGSWMVALDVAGLGSELLEGMSFSTSPAYEVWLLGARRHLQAASEAVLREAALSRLAAGRHDDAIDLAARTVALNPFDESYQELLIRSYATAGDEAAAGRQLAACVELFRRDLGVEPGEAVFSAARAGAASSTAPAVGGRAAARAQLEAGEAAVSAGALDAGIECLRRSAAESHAVGDVDLKAKALLSLGGALVHAARGRDEEGAAALHEAAVLARRSGDRRIEARATRELAHLDVLRGRYERARSQLAAAADLADDEGERAWVRSLFGVCSIETGRYAEAMNTFQDARVQAEAAGDQTLLALLEIEIGRGYLLSGDVDPARPRFAHGVEIAREGRMTGIVPWTEAWLGIADVQTGRLDDAADVLEHAFALACQLEDPCWEGLAAVGLGLLTAARDDPDGALDRLDDACVRANRTSDGALWVVAYALDAFCTLAVARRPDQAQRRVADLETLAARTGMNEFLARAHMHRHDLGDAHAIEPARAAADDVDNPCLREAIATRELTRRAT